MVPGHFIELGANCGANLARGTGADCWTALQGRPEGIFVNPFEWSESCLGRAAFATRRRKRALTYFNDSFVSDGRHHRPTLARRTGLGRERSGRGLRPSLRRPYGPMKSTADAG
jgi:hypothetical protein